MMAAFKTVQDVPITDFNRHYLTSSSPPDISSTSLGCLTVSPLDALLATPASANRLEQPRLAGTFLPLQAGLIESLLPDSSDDG